MWHNHAYSTPIHELFTSIKIPTPLMCCISLLQEGDLDEQIAQTPFNDPYIAVVQTDCALDMFLVIERKVVCKVRSVFQAVKVLLASYFVFNISYPYLIGGLLVFCMLYVCKIKPKENISVSVLQLYSAIDRL